LGKLRARPGIHCATWIQNAIRASSRAFRRLFAASFFAAFTPGFSDKIRDVSPGQTIENKEIAVS
jgi:hypothetical protein